MGSNGSPCVLFCVSGHKFCFSSLCVRVFTYALRHGADTQQATGAVLGIRATIESWLKRSALPGRAVPVSCVRASGRNYAGLKSLALLVVLACGGYAPTAQAAPVCLADIDGPNDPPGDGQGDITRLCVDKANLPASFDVYMSWDEDGFNGANTGDACVLFDTDGDAGGFIDYAICISVDGNPASLSAGPLIYSCGNTAADKCTQPVTITPSGATTCSASVQSEDPFPAGDDYPDDTVGICTIDVSDIPSGAVRTSLCSFPSINSNSDPRTASVSLVAGLSISSRLCR